MQLSIDARLAPAEHLAVGRALAPLRDEGVLVLGSGNVVHNLRHALTALHRGETRTPEWAREFDAGIALALARRDADHLVRALASEVGRLAHPTPDHYLPLLCAAGASAPEDPVAEKGKPGFEQAVSIALAKRAGTNAPELARTVERKVEALRGRLIPSSVKVTVTRNYGDTAEEKSSELIEHLVLATLSVIAFIALAMGWRSAAVELPSRGRRADRPSSEPRRQGRSKSAEPRHRDARPSGTGGHRLAARRQAQGGRDPARPPVLDTLVAEVYGPSAAERDRLAGQVLAAFRSTKGVVDIDSSLAATSPKLALRLDAEKAALHGVVPAAVIQTLAAGGAGASLGSFHVERGAAQVPMVLQLAPAQRARVEDLLQLTVPGRRGPVPLSEVVSAEDGRVDPPVFHKNLLPVAYVFGDLAGEIESPVYALAELNGKLEALRGAGGEAVPRLGLAHPASTEQPALKWDGEWHITLEVFRDLGIAFAVMLLVIYFLVVGWFQSFAVPWVILVPIPLSLIGVLPAHFGLGAFFTATSMIGFIAGAGIIVRNSIILVDFIELKLREGMPLAAAVEEAGVVRFRPMLLTATAVLVGSAVMLADPIFQGLAVSLMAGEVAATVLSRVAVPVLYFLVTRRGRAAELQREGALSRGRLLAAAAGPALAVVSPVRQRRIAP